MGKANQTEKNNRIPHWSDPASMHLQFPKLRSASLFFISHFPSKLNRISLCKHLYYADGHFYQKVGRPITELPYVHIEGSPQPRFFNEIMHAMVLHREIEVTPQVVKELQNEKPTTVLKGLSFRALVDPDFQFSKEEEKVMRSTASLLNGELALETRYYPHLYQQYTQTGLYEEVPFMQFPDGKRPHLSWKAWADKIFRLMGQ